MKRIISLATGMLLVVSVECQNVVNWNFSVKKIGDKTYELHLTPAVQSPWHIYSQTSPEGGALPTTIVFNKNPFIKMEGETKEVGKVVSKYEEVFSVTVKYFEGKVDFVQTIKLKADVNTTISGAVEFMVCNEEQCLPPKTVSFNVAIK